MSRLVLGAILVERSDLATLMKSELAYVRPVRRRRMPVSFIFVLVVEER